MDNIDLSALEECTCRRFIICAPDQGFMESSIRIFSLLIPFLSCQFPDIVAKWYLDQTLIISYNLHCCNIYFNIQICLNDGNNYCNAGMLNNGYLNAGRLSNVYYNVQIRYNDYLSQLITTYFFPICIFSRQVLKLQNTKKRRKNTLFPLQIISTKCWLNVLQEMMFLESCRC